MIKYLCALVQLGHSWWWICKWRKSGWHDMLPTQRSKLQLSRSACCWYRQVCKPAFAGPFVFKNNVQPGQLCLQFIPNPLGFQICETTTVVSPSKSPLGTHVWDAQAAYASKVSSHPAVTVNQRETWHSRRSMLIEVDCWRSASNTWPC